MKQFDDIIPPSRRKESEAQMGARQPFSGEASTRGRTRFPLRTALITLIVVTGTTAGLWYFSHSSVEVIPNTETVSISAPFTAEMGTGELPFEIIRTEKIASKSVAGSGSKSVTEPASGTITIYNEQQTPQILIEKTRFAAKSGQVFRIRSSITVPKGSQEKPGTITATVYADQPGDASNIGPTTFTLPGLAGTPQFSQVYARSSEPMKGGVSGEMPIVSSDLEAETRAELSSAILPDLMQALKESVPEGYVLLPGAATSTIVADRSTPSATTGMVDVRQLGVAVAVVFPADALGKVLAKNGLGDRYHGGDITITSAENLRLASAVTPTKDLASYPFTLTGTADLVYTINADRIASAIAGKTRASSEVVVTSFPEVKRARIILRPFWRQSLPEDPAGIKIDMVAP